MKLWHLWRSGTGHYGTHQAFVVRAETEEQARELAQELANSRGWGDLVGSDRKMKRRYTWENADLSNCEELKPEGNSEVIVECILYFGC
jgi:hypothetical protein